MDTSVAAAWTRLRGTERDLTSLRDRTGSSALCAIPTHTHAYTFPTLYTPQHLPHSITSTRLRTQNVYCLRYVLLGLSSTEMRRSPVRDSQTLILSGLV